MFKNLLPQTIDFFEFFEEHSKISIKVAEKFLSMCNGEISISECATEVKNLEHKADDVTRRCFKAIQKTFITPFDRGAILSLIKNQDDITDMADEVISRLNLFEITEFRVETKQFCEILDKSIRILAEVVNFLRDLKNEPLIKQKCISIKKLENEADELLRSSLTRLFKEEKDPITIIKWKEIFEHFEAVTDICEDVANLVQGIVVEAS